MSCPSIPRRPFPFFVALMSVALTASTQLSAQRILHESLTNGAVWSYSGSSGVTRVQGASWFGIVHQLSSATTFTYARKAVTLYPGSYRATVRHREFAGQDGQPLTLTAWLGSTPQVATSPAPVDDAWVQTRPVTFRLTSPTSVVFTFGNPYSLTTERNRQFDSFTLERLAFHGTASRDRCGRSVSGAGDVDGDGLADVIVGIPGDQTKGTDAGAARVLSGVDGRVLHTFFGGAGDSFGAAVSGAGDVNGDGVADLIVGAPYDSEKVTDAGSAQVFSGRDGKVLFTLHGAAAGDRFGYSVSGADDVNGDGYADFIVGSRYGDSSTAKNSGCAHVFSGRNGKVLYTFYGDGADDQLGYAVGGAGDVDGDGFGDLIVGAPFDDDKGAASGSARIFSGRDGKVLKTLFGNSYGDFFGWSVSGAGDVNGDGLADLIVGSPGDDNNGTDSGSARVFSGKDFSVLQTFEGNAGERLGSSVRAAGDIDADGKPDVIVGAPSAQLRGTSSGSARVFSGSGDLLLECSGDSAGDGLGWSVAGAGDINGDGLADLIVGIPGDAPWPTGFSAGSARIVLGRAVHHAPKFTFNGSVAGAQFGSSVGAAGDVNGDGYPDLIVGARLDSNNTAKVQSGAVRVISGAPGFVARRTLYEVHGTRKYDFFGSSVSGAGDLNRDGYADFIVGAPGERDLNGKLAGTARTYSGKDGKVLHTYYGPVGSNFGISVRGAADVDGDGYTDVIVGSCSEDSGKGRARVFSGKDTRVLRTWRADSTWIYFGRSVSGAGDVNGDGYADVIVGARSTDNGTFKGRARVFSGKDGTILHNFSHAFGSSTNQALASYLQGYYGGCSVAGGGDVNGDGYADLIVGTDLDNGSAGSARVYSGQDGKVLLNLTGGRSGNRFGYSVAGAGDVNGDGYADVVVGAPASQAGRILVFSGRDGNLLHAFSGDSGGDFFGESVNSAGDLNRDGLADLIVGAPWDDNNGSASGSSRVFLSRSYRTPGRTTVYGSPSPDSRGYRPRIGVSGQVVTGRTIQLTLRAAPKSAPGVLVIGPRTDIALLGIRILAYPAVLLFQKTDASGNAWIPLPMSTNPAHVGFAISMQWGIEDPVTRRLCSSDGVTIQQGSPFPW